MHGGRGSVSAPCMEFPKVAHFLKQFFKTKVGHLKGLMSLRNYFNGTFVKVMMKR